MTASAFIGLGSGQKILGARAAPFFLTQLAGGAVAMSGVARGYRQTIDSNTGFATVMVSRVWEIVDLIQIVANNGRPAGARNPASAERSVNVSFAPIVDTRSRGVGLRYTF